MVAIVLADSNEAKALYKKVTSRKSTGGAHTVFLVISADVLICFRQSQGIVLKEETSQGRKDR